MKQRSYLSFVFPALLLLGLGCSQSSDPNQDPYDPANLLPVAMDIPNPCGLATTDTLFAGQTIGVGTVTIANDGENLCVTYKTTGNWYLTEDHMDMALTPEEIPQTGSGNPRPGQFTYSHVLETPAQSDEYCFTLAELEYLQGQLLYIAAHCKVIRIEDGVTVQSETAWGDGLPFPGANWATYMEHTIQVCGDVAEEGGGSE